MEIYHLLFCAVFLSTVIQASIVDYVCHGPPYRSAEEAMQMAMRIPAIIFNVYENIFDPHLNALADFKYKCAENNRFTMQGETAIKIINAHIGQSKKLDEKVKVAVLDKMAKLNPLDFIRKALNANHKGAKDDTLNSFLTQYTSCYFADKFCTSHRDFSNALFELEKASLSLLIDTDLLKLVGITDKSLIKAYNDLYNQFITGSQTLKVIIAKESKVFLMPAGAPKVPNIAEPLQNLLHLKRLLKPLGQ